MSQYVDTRRYDVALADAGQMEAVGASSCLARAIHYYQLLWGIFSPGDLVPNVQIFGRFSIALTQLVKLYPLDLTSWLGGPVGSQQEGWMTNLFCLHQIAGFELMDTWEFSLPEPFSFADEVDRYQKRAFVQAYIRYCQINLARPGREGWFVNEHLLAKAIQEMATGQLVLDLGTQVPISEGSYRSVFYEMLEHQGPFLSPPPPR